MKKFTAYIALTAGVLFICFLAFSTQASALTKSSITVEPLNDFVIEPAKFEIFLNPGDTITKYITITSRIQGTTQFSIGTEDLRGTTDAQQPVILMGDERGPYSVKDYIKPETDTFSLNYGEQVQLPVTVTIPQDAEPKGFYGAVVISTKLIVGGTTTSATNEVQGGTRLVSRVGSLFLVRINGAANESGALLDFKPAGSKLLEKGPDSFEMLFKNSGTVHLVPHGLITVSNILGRKVAEIPVDAYFSLPDSIRYRQVQWINKGFLIGKYQATISLYRGYANLTDTKTVTFWVLPWKIVVIALIILLAIVSFFYFILSRFEFRRKR